MIKVGGVTKKFGSFTALNGLDLNVAAGCVYGLVGANGAGKTTIMKILAGIYRPDEGIVEIDGENPFENPGVKNKSVYISDDPFFFGSYTVKDMAGLYSQVYSGWDWQRFEKLREVFKIDPRRRPITLSKGMKKQAAFWLALSTHPKVLILDEPMDGLDPVMRRNVWSLIMQDVSEHGLTVLVSSHNLRELEDVCDYVGIMSEGKLLMEKALDEVKGGVHKLQVAFKGEFPAQLKEALDVLHSERFGSVDLLIVKGSREDILRMASSYSPVICELLPLSLEEVFIYEMALDGYNVKDIII